MANRIPNGRSVVNPEFIPNTRRRFLQRGFTLIELMVVMAIISVMIAIAVPIYQKSIIRAKESVLRSNLFTIRNMIDEYTVDKQKAPESLQELVTDRIPTAGAPGPDDRFIRHLEDHHGRDPGRRRKQFARHLRHPKRLRQKRASTEPTTPTGRRPELIKSDCRVSNPHSLIV